MFIVVMNMCYVMFSFINNLLYVIIIMLIYGIKMTWKLPSFLTEVAAPNLSLLFFLL
jgi:hypothetical protein